MWSLRRGALVSEGDKLTEGLTESSAHGRERAGKGTRDRGQEMVLSGAWPREAGHPREGKFEPWGLEGPGDQEPGAGQEVTEGQSSGGGGLRWVRREAAVASHVYSAKSLQSCPTLCDPIDGSPQGPPSLGFSRQEHWSGLPFPSPMCILVFLIFTCFVI